MSLPRYNSSDKISQRVFYSELKKQLELIDKIEDRRERARRMARLRIYVYNVIMYGKKEEIPKKSFIRSFFSYIKQVIFNLIDRIKKGI